MSFTELLLAFGRLLLHLPTYAASPCGFVRSRAVLRGVGGIILHYGVEEMLSFALAVGIVRCA